MGDIDRRRLRHRVFAFRNLVERSLRVQSRVALLDSEIYHRDEQKAVPVGPDRENAVKAQQTLLSTAFGNS